MPFRIAFVGAGSIGFTRKLVADILSVPELRSCELAFMDINDRNLDMVRQLVERDAMANGLDKVRIVATQDRREALAGARYVFVVFRVGGLEAFALDVDIPLKYGVDQCVGDTLSAGGIMYGQRGIPAILAVCKDIREVASPACVLFNYANPMAMLTWAANKYGRVRTVGLCHGVQGGHKLIADALGLPKSEVDIVCAGINHQTWYLRIGHKGQDVSGRLLEALERHPEFSRTEKVRIDMLRRFGCFSTESNGHLSEYVAWYRKRPNEIGEWISLGESWIHGETGGYLRHCSEQRNWFEEDFPKWLAEPPMSYDAGSRSEEHGSHILEGLETGRIYRGHFNVPNDGVIANLPPDCVVEAPGYVDRTGINMPVVGDLPLGCAAICGASVQVQRLAVEAAVRGDDLLLRQAMMMDPLVGAVCNPPEIWQMTDEMLVAQERWLPQYAGAIAAARGRLASGRRLPTREGYRGAARLQAKSVEDLRRQRGAARRG